MNPYTIVLADDHALFRGGVKRIIKEHADFLFISTHTVRRHREKIMKKLNLKGMIDLLKYAFAEGYISPD